MGSLSLVDPVIVVVVFLRFLSFLRSSFGFSGGLRLGCGGLRLCGLLLLLLRLGLLLWLGCFLFFLGGVLGFLGLLLGRLGLFLFGIVAVLFAFFAGGGSLLGLLSGLLSGGSALLVFIFAVIFNVGSPLGTTVVHEEVIASLLL